MVNFRNSTKSLTFFLTIAPLLFPLLRQQNITFHLSFHVAKLPRKRKQYGKLSQKVTKNTEFCSNQESCRGKTNEQTTLSEDDLSAPADTTCLAQISHYADWEGVFSECSRICSWNMTHTLTHTHITHTKAVIYSVLSWEWLAVGCVCLFSVIYWTWISWHASTFFEW